MSKTIVKFHDVNEAPYGCFSILSPHPIVVRHVQYPSLHHYFLCERYKASAVEEEIRAATSLWEVERIVKKAESQGLQRDDWDRVKTDVMLLGTYYKFRQNLDAQVILLQTGAKTIVDHTSNDSFWGDGDGTGKNLNGIILMATRKRLLLEEKSKKKPDQKKKV